MQEDDRSVTSGRPTPNAAPDDARRTVGARRADRPVDAESTVLMAAITADTTAQTYSAGRRAKAPAPVPGSRRKAAPAVPAYPSFGSASESESTMVIPAITSISAARPGARRAAAASSRRRLSFAVAGAAAVAVAAFGSLGVGPSVSVMAGQDAALAKNYVGTKNATNAVDVSRDYERALAVQKPLQAQQRTKALAQYNASSQKSAQAVGAERIRNQWVLPVVGYHLTARFGQGGGLWSSGRHTGLDFAGPSGTPIVAVAGGTVTSAGYEGAYGNRTIITLADGTEIWYCHQSSIQVTVGQKVAPSELIGHTGSTGNVTGPHLHLEVHPGGGDPVDPYAVLVSHDVTP